MKMSLGQRLTGSACDAVVVLLFGCVLIGAGHGAAPIGFLMFAGDLDVWGLPMLTGWLAIAGLVVAAFVPLRGLYLGLVILASILVLVAWCLFVAQSASIFSSVVLFSIPFLAAAAGRSVLLAFQARHRSVA